MTSRGSASPAAIAAVGVVALPDAAPRATPAPEVLLSTTVVAACRYYGFDDPEEVARNLTAARQFAASGMDDPSIVERITAGGAIDALYVG